jgi:hypothetical protein
MAGKEKRIILFTASQGAKRMWSGPGKNLYWLIIFCLWSAFPLHSASGPQKSGNYLVIENPAALKIYNKYEQRIDAQELQLFKPFCALRLTGINTTLSDNFTLADRVEMDGETFYLLKSNRQSFDLLRPAGYLKEFRGVAVIEDTIVISRDNRIFLQTPAAAAPKTPLPSGTLLRRIFASGNKTYILLLDQNRLYGWCNLADRRSWRKFDQPLAETKLTNILQQLQKIFDRYNSLYRQSFQYFNIQNAEHRAIPYWQLELKNKQISADLHNIPGLSAFQYSLPYLINELQQNLRNTHLHITQTDNGIEIR